MARHDVVVAQLSVRELTQANQLRWVVFALGGAAFWLAFFHRVAPVAIADELTQAFQVNSTALGALAATYFYVYTIMQVPTGVLVDTLGPKRVSTIGGLVAGGGIICVAGPRLSAGNSGSRLGRRPGDTARTVVRTSADHVEATSDDH